MDAQRAEAADQVASSSAAQPPSFENSEEEDCVTSLSSMGAASMPTSSMGPSSSLGSSRITGPSTSLTTARLSVSRAFAFRRFRAQPVPRPSHQNLGSPSREWSSEAPVVDYSAPPVLTPLPGPLSTLLHHSTAARTQTRSRKIFFPAGRGGRGTSVETALVALLKLHQHPLECCERGNAEIHAFLRAAGAAGVGRHNGRGWCGCWYAGRDFKEPGIWDWAGEDATEAGEDATLSPIAQTPSSSSSPGRRGVPSPSSSSSRRRDSASSDQAGGSTSTPEGRPSARGRLRISLLQPVSAHGAEINATPLVSTLVLKEVLKEALEHPFASPSNKFHDVAMAGAGRGSFTRTVFATSEEADACAAGEDDIQRRGHNALDGLLARLGAAAAWRVNGITSTVRVGEEFGGEDQPIPTVPEALVSFFEEDLGLPPGSRAVEFLSEPGGTQKGWRDASASEGLAGPRRQLTITVVPRYRTEAGALVSLLEWRWRVLGRGHARASPEIYQNTSDEEGGRISQRGGSSRRGSSSSGPPQRSGSSRPQGGLSQLHAGGRRSRRISNRLLPPAPPPSMSPPQQSPPPTGASSPPPPATGSTHHTTTIVEGPRATSSSTSEQVDRATPESGEATEERHTWPGARPSSTGGDAAHQCRARLLVAHDSCFPSRPRRVPALATVVPRASARFQHTASEDPRGTSPS